MAHESKYHRRVEKRNLMRIVRTGALLTLLAAAFVPGPASAAPPYVLDDPAHPSAVTVTGGMPFLATNYGSKTEVICVTLVNKVPRTATRINLSLAAVDATGAVVGVDLMSAGGTFPVGVAVAFVGIVAFAVSAREIQYDDGTV
jgi:hypothetical protein